MKNLRNIKRIILFLSVFAVTTVGCSPEEEKEIPGLEGTSWISKTTTESIEIDGNMTLEMRKTTVLHFNKGNTGVLSYKEESPEATHQGSMSFSYSYDASSGKGSITEYETSATLDFAYNEDQDNLILYAYGGVYWVFQRMQS